MSAHLICLIILGALVILAALVGMAAEMKREPFALKSPDFKKKCEVMITDRGYKCRINGKTEHFLLAADTGLYHGILRHNTHTYFIGNKNHIGRGRVASSAHCWVGVTFSPR